MSVQPDTLLAVWNQLVSYHICFVFKTLIYIFFLFDPIIIKRGSPLVDPQPPRRHNKIPVNRLKHVLIHGFIYVNIQLQTSKELPQLKDVSSLKLNKNSNMDQEILRNYE